MELNISSLSCSVTNHQRSVPISLYSVRRVLEFLCREAIQPPIAVHFVGERKITSLHQELFKDPTPTDCITLPFDDPLFLGEVIVCPKTAQKYIQSHGGDLYEEILLYIVHGFLHLLGYKDTTEQEQRQMRLAENKWLQKLAKKKLSITT